MKLEVEAGQFVRMSDGQIVKIPKKTSADDIEFAFMEQDILGNKIKKSSHNLIDLIEYMDLLNIENPIKLYDKEIEVSLFNPVRCDGFTKYEDGTTCIILNLDYFVDVKTLKVKSVLTHEQFKVNEYKV